MLGSSMHVPSGPAWVGQVLTMGMVRTRQILHPLSVLPWRGGSLPTPVPSQHCSRDGVTVERDLSIHCSNCPRPSLAYLKGQEAHSFQNPEDHIFRHECNSYFLAFPTSSEGLTSPSLDRSPRRPPPTLELSHCPISSRLPFGA